MNFLILEGRLGTPSSTNHHLYWQILTVLPNSSEVFFDRFLRVDREIAMQLVGDLVNLKKGEEIVALGARGWKGYPRETLHALLELPPFEKTEHGFVKKLDFSNAQQLHVPPNTTAESS